MELTILDIKGKSTGRTASLPEAFFGIEPNDHAIYLAVKQYLANQRQGTHKSKERNEVSGSTRKLLKQKGTGGARHGSIKAPIYVGGGRVFGPRPRDYSFKLNKKVKTLAKASALSYKAKESGISVLEKFNFDKPQTKEYIALLNNLELSGKKTLLVTATSAPNVVLSARNLPKTKVSTIDTLNVYDILHADNIIFVEDSIEKFAQI